ncbi:hypothetical protein TSMEX_000962 [Taenia solium]|eukprot:TsM_000976000 transcript=TsM_000976000 gene=TsM_000976000
MYITYKMDWSQFADPQFLLGMGVLAFGAINAYMLRRQHHQAAAERAEQTGEQGDEIVEQPEVLQSKNTAESSGAIDQAIQGKGDEFEATDETPTRDAATEGD